MIKLVSTQSPQHLQDFSVDYDEGECETLVVSGVGSVDMVVEEEGKKERENEILMQRPKIDSQMH